MSDQDTLKKYLERCFTVGELKDMLDGYDDDQKVVIASTASDYWRSPIAQRIETVDQIAVGWTEYHRCLSNLSEKDSEDPDDDGTETVVAIYV